MSIDSELAKRSGGQCELCASKLDLSTYEVPPYQQIGMDGCIQCCTVCQQQLNEQAALDEQHWRCLSDCIWSEVPAVKVIAWRLLKRLSDKPWAQNLSEMAYFDDATLEWAQSEDMPSTVTHRDSNGTVLEAGDSVTLIKDLNVKGTSFIAKRGATVRKISLVADNAEHIEGRVNGQLIVILTQFVKKTS